MNGPLRLMLLGIVLLNLGFVQLTNAVGLQWMWCLWVAAAVAPALERWRERLAYRAIWNAAVLASFTFLVNDAMTSGLLHMLEDGLLLAALCQVHLLNNVGSRQRPDLLFFNSFLIAFVTSFFCGDLEWSLCFCGYAALLVPALQLFVASRHADIEPAQVRALLRDGLPRSLVALGMTGIAFVAWPRDFHREGWLGDALQFGGQAMVAFAEEVRVDRADTPRQSDVEVLRIDHATVAPTHWRGATFVEFDGAGWQPYRVFDFGTRAATDLAWDAVGRNEWRRALEPRGDPLRVHLLDRSSGRLFLPLEACGLRIDDDGRAVLVDPKADAVVAFAADDGVLPTVTVQLGSPRRPMPVSARAHRRLVSLPQRLPRALRDLAAALRRDLPPTAPPDAVAEHARSWLAERRNYSLPGTPGAARSLDDFVLGTGGGHCEYFATTLALLLRLHDIPCRVVGGYLAHERDESTGVTIVRERDAHAWVEWLSPERGWTTLDATPANAVQRGDSNPSWWQLTIAALRSAWGRVAGFGADDRRALFAWVTELPARVLATATEHPIAVLAMVVGALGGLHWRRRRRSAPAAVVQLLRACRRAGLQPQTGETPRELLARATARDAVDPVQLQQLARAVRAHESARYSVPATVNR